MTIFNLFNHITYRTFINYSFNIKIIFRYLLKVIQNTQMKNRDICGTLFRIIFYSMAIR